MTRDPLLKSKSYTNIFQNRKHCLYTEILSSPPHLQTPKVAFLLEN